MKFNYLTKTALLILLITLLNDSIGKAQTCGNTQVCNGINTTVAPIDSSANALAYASYLNAPVEIPVVFHVLHHPDDNVIGQGSNISDETIETALAYTNLAFQGYFDDVEFVNTNIQLCPATKNPIGLTAPNIIRHSAPIFHTYDLDDYPNYLLMHEFYPPWNPINYLNIWIVEEINGRIALASAPDSHGFPHDGVVIEASQISIDNGGFKVLAHEIGHYFGLIHSATLPEFGCAELDCTLEGDKVCDTPANNNGIVYCSNNYYDCDGIQHTPDDFMNDGVFTCFKRFTPGQKDRMRAYLIGIRPSLIESAGCSEVFANDASIWEINGIEEYACTAQVTPSINIANSGSNALTSLQILYGTDADNLNTFDWTGNIPQGEFALISLPELNLEEGQQEFYVSLNQPNGATDEEYSNNELSQSVFYSKTIENFFYENMEYTLSNAIHIENPDNNYTWEIVDIANCSSNANKAIMLQNWEYNNKGTEDIFMLKVNLDSFDDPYLQFDYAYSQYSPSQCENLVLSVQQECQGYYTHILFDKTQELPTTYPPYNSNNPFSPTSCGDWEEAYISLTYLKQTLSGDIYISFKSINDNGNNLFIDNIIINNASGEYECPAPTDLLSQVQGGNDVLISWEGTSYVDNYIIDAKVASSSDWVNYGTNYGFENTSFTFDNLLFNESYDVRIGAVCENGETTYAYTEFVNYYANCSSPENIWVTDSGDDFITIQFTLNSEITTYEIHLQEAFSADFTIVTTNIETYTFEDLNPNTQYNINIYSICDGVLSYNSAFTSAQTTGDSSCPAPTNLSITDISETSAILNFDEVAGALQYFIVVNDLDAGYSNTNSFELENLSAGEVYSVFVYSLCFDGTTTSTGEFSEVIYFETVSLECAFVNSFNYNILSPTSINISWSNTGAYYYIVEFRPANTFTNPNAGWSSNSTTVYPPFGTINLIIELPSCGEYEIRIKTICENGLIGNSEFETINSCPPPPSICDAPTNLIVSDITNESANINWDGPSNAWVYDISLVIASTGFNVTNFMVMADTNTILEDLLPNTEYCFHIRTWCLSGLSEYTTICFTTDALEPCIPPFNIEAINITANGAELIWEDMPDAWGYDISLTASNGFTVLNGLVFNNFYSFDDLAPNTTYTFEIASYCAPEFSEAVSITFTTEALPQCTPPDLVLQIPFPSDPAFIGLFFTAFDTEDYSIHYYPSDDINAQETINVSGSNAFIPIENFTCAEYTILVYGICDGELSEEASIIYYQPDCDPFAEECLPPNAEIEVPFESNPQWIYLVLEAVTTSEYKVFYQVVGTTWEEELDLTSNTFISLQTCEEYVFYIYGVCDGVLSEEATVIYYDPQCIYEDWATNCGNAYIESFGLNTLFNLSNTDAEYCYYDYTGITAQIQVQANTNYNAALNPGGASEGQYWRIWIDSNGDDQFTDTDLMIYDGYNSDPYAPLVAPLTMPNICSTITTLRVSMQTFSDGPPELGVDLLNGQTEDYTINFGNCKTNQIIKETTQFNIYPNPAQNQAFARFEAITEDENSVLMIYNTTGQIVQQQTITISNNTNTIALEVDQLSPGMYMVNLNTANKTYSHKLIVTE